MMIINDMNMKELGIHVSFDSEDSLTPDVQTHFQSTRLGSINYGTSFGNREFEFSCFIKGDNIPYNINQFVRLFFDTKGKSKEVKLQCHGFDNKYFLVTLSNTIKLNYLAEDFATFDVQLTATNPLAFSIYESASYHADVDGSVGGGYEIPINYYGSYPTEFYLSLFGSLSYFDIEEHRKDGSKNIFHYVTGSHDTFIKIDFRDFTIDDNGSNGLPYASGKFLQIDQNTEKIVFRGDIKGSMNFAYRETYI